MSFTVFKETFECFENVDGTLSLKKLEKVLQCIGYNPTHKEMKDYTSMFSYLLDNDGMYKIFDTQMRRTVKKTYLLKCTPSEDLDQPAHLCNLIRVFVVHTKKLFILGYPNCAQ